MAQQWGEFHSSRGMGSTVHPQKWGGKDEKRQWTLTSVVKKKNEAKS